MRTTSAALIVLLSLVGGAKGWSIPSSSASSKALLSKREGKIDGNQSRRDWLQQISSVGVVTAAAGIAFPLSPLPASAVATGVLIDELSELLGFPAM